MKNVQVAKDKKLSNPTNVSGSFVWDAKLLKNKKEADAYFNTNGFGFVNSFIDNNNFYNVELKKESFYENQKYIRTFHTISKTENNTVILSFTDKIK
jgi:hypothetical protein